MNKYIKPVVYLLLVLWAAMNICLIFAPAGYLSLDAFAIMVGGVFSAWLEWETFKLLSKHGLTYEKIENVMNEEV